MSPPLKFLTLPLLTLLVSCGSEEAPQVPAEPQAVSSAASGPELGTFGVDLSHQDPGVRPGDDFFRFANGIWLDTFELPSDRSNYGTFNKLGDVSDERVRVIINDFASREPTPGTLEQKISDYFLSFMDVDTVNELGISPLLPGLAALREIDTREELIAGFGRAMIDNTATPFGFYVGADRSDPDRHQLVLSVGGLGLPDRDYYLLDTEQFANVREEYVAHIARMLDFADIDNSSARAEAILALETQIAEYTWPRAQRRNRD